MIPADKRIGAAGIHREDGEVILNRTHLLCQQIRSVRAAGVRRMRNLVPKVYLEAKWQDQNCLALREQIGLRYKILPSVTNDG